MFRKLSRRLARAVRGNIKQNKIQVNSMGLAIQDFINLLLSKLRRTLECWSHMMTRSVIRWANVARQPVNVAHFVEKQRLCRWCNCRITESNVTSRFHWSDVILARRLYSYDSLAYCKRRKEKTAGCYRVRDLMRTVSGTAARAH